MRAHYKFSKNEGRKNPYIKNLKSITVRELRDAELQIAKITAESDRLSYSMPPSCDLF